MGEKKRPTITPPTNRRGWRWYRFKDDGAFYLGRPTRRDGDGFVWVGELIEDEPPRPDPNEVPPDDTCEALAKELVHQNRVVRWERDQRDLEILARKHSSSKGGKREGPRPKTFDRNEVILDRFQNLRARYERNGMALDDATAAKLIWDQAKDGIDPVDEEIAALQPNTIRRIIGREKE